MTLSVQAQQRVRRSRPQLLFLLVLIYFVTGGLLAQTRYTVTEIGLPGGTNSHADGIDDLGRVVGGSEYDSNSDQRMCGDYYAPEGITGHREHAFIWVGGTISDINPFNGGKSGANGITLSAHIVGRSTTHLDPGVVHGFLWTSPHQPVDLGSLPGGTNSNTDGINEHDVIVGGSSAGDADPAPYYWNGSQMVKMDSNGSTFAEATSINAAGNVSGFAVQPDGSAQAVFWHQPGDAPQLLPGNPGGLAFGINNLTQVAGFFVGVISPCILPNPPGCTTAVVWQNGTSTSLGTLAPGTASSAFAINDHGKVVGYATVNQQNGTAERAFVWDATNGMKDLNSMITGAPGWKLQRANAINNPGQIVGCGTRNGKMRAFLLTPQ